MRLCPFHHAPRGDCCRESAGVVVEALLLVRAQEALAESGHDELAGLIGALLEHGGALPPGVQITTDGSGANPLRDYPPSVAPRGGIPYERTRS